MEWYDPDDRWEVWGIKTKGEFVDKFVVPGKFHGRVPKDVVVAFDTVTHLMAYAYYHYSLLDVAMEKALLIMEMAVKLKAERLGIELKRKPSKRNEVYDKTLNEIIGEVCKYKEIAFLKPEFDRARQWRNTKMHPKNHTISGPIGYPHRNAMLFVNVINKFFMSNKELSFMDKRQRELKEKLKKFNYGLFVLEYSKGRILITTIYDLKFIKMGRKEVVVVFLQPVLNDVITAVQNYDHTPFILGFSEFLIDRNTISGVDINENKVRIYPSSGQKNLPIWEKYENDWASLTEEQQNEFIQFNAREALWKMEELIYEQCWN